jgi:dolichol-phosphate mannosyltransferase
MPRCDLEGFRAGTSFRTMLTQSTDADLACACVELINHIQAGRKIGIDCNPDSAERLASDVEFHQAAASDPAYVVPGWADVVFTSNFLERLPDKRAASDILGQVHGALKPGGAT